MSTTAVLAGSTGLVGSHILSTLLAQPSISSIHAFTRRDLPNPSPKLHAITSSSSNDWPSLFPSSPAPALYLSALGTTRAQAGGLAAQRAIDHDLNLSLARAAHAAGVPTFVLVSSAGASSGSLVPYSKMKGELEDAVKALGFRHAVIVRPGLIVGDREDSRPAEWLMRSVARGLGAVSGGKLADFWAQDALVIARAAVSAGMACVRGEREEGVWVLEQSDVVRLGRTEWKEDVGDRKQEL